MLPVARRRGFSLVEMMVALALGLVVVGAVGAVFLSSKRAYSATETLGRAQESARFAMQFISREIQLAGYSEQHEWADNWEDVYPASGQFVKGAVVFGEDNVTEAGVMPGSDRLTVRYAGSAAAPLRSCAGTLLDSPTTQTVTRLYVNSSGVLICEVGGVEFELVDGIRDLQLTYGRDTLTDTAGGKRLDGSVGSYRAAPAVDSWAYILSVRVALTVAGGGDDVLDREVVTAVAMRNLIP